MIFMPTKTNGAYPDVVPTADEGTFPHLKKIYPDPTQSTSPSSHAMQLGRILVRLDTRQRKKKDGSRNKTLLACYPLPHHAANRNLKFSLKKV